MRILIADDEAPIRRTLREILERAGHQVVGDVTDGALAVALARSLRPDVAVLDDRMPQLDGLDAARRMTAERPTPVVLLSERADPDLIAASAEAGVFGLLMKPVQPGALVSAVSLAHARFLELQAVRSEAATLVETLETRKVVERAKGILMRREDLGEDEAFVRLRRASQASGRPLRIIAEAVIATLGDGPRGPSVR